MPVPQTLSQQIDPGSDPAEITRRAKRLEAPFAAGAYDGRRRFRPAEWVFLPGPGRVLISAPHAINHLRDGRVKNADRYTGAIAREVHRAAGQPLVARVRGPAGDPNWDRVSPYKDAIAAAAARGEIAAVLDLHGANRTRAFDLALGSAGVRAPWIETAAGVLRAAGLDQLMVNGDRFTATYPGTVTWFAAYELGLPAVQVEINGFYRAPVRRPIAYRQAVEALVALTRFLQALVS